MNSKTLLNYIIVLLKDKLEGEIHSDENLITITFKDGTKRLILVA